MASFLSRSALALAFCAKAFSLWAFDSFYIWIPIAAPSAQLFTTWFAEYSKPAAETCSEKDSFQNVTIY